MGSLFFLGGFFVKRGDDVGMSFEDDGLFRSFLEMFLLFDMGFGIIIKVSVVCVSFRFR